MRVCELQEGSCSAPHLLIYVQANRARLETLMLLGKKQGEVEGRLWDWWCCSANRKRKRRVISHSAS